MNNGSKKSCPRCGSYRLFDWDELNDEQKMLVERLQDPDDIGFRGAKYHLYCIRCWFIDKGEKPDLA